MNVPSVLVVEHERELSERIAAALQAQGCEVTPAFDALEAVTELQRGQYDCLVIDFDVAEADALAVMLFVGRNRPELLQRTIVITGETSPHTPGYAPMATVLLRNPVDLAALAECVARATNART